MKQIELLGSDEQIFWERNEKGLEIVAPKVKSGHFAYAFKMQ